ncbi:hypothetical protein ABZ456_31955 [Streptomyces sp. NPDC005776]|uniref:hypothetical protein n=1 Tax=Streptomyces sp. NPDC005776 TaxID=3154676 RepID=UPI00340F58C9
MAGSCDHRGSLVFPTVAQRLRVEAEADLIAAAERLAHIPIEGMSAGRDEFSTIRSSPGAEFLSTGDAVATRTRDLAMQATSEFFAAQPNTSEPGDLKIASDVLDPAEAHPGGTEVRILCRPVALDCMLTRDRVDDLIKGGSEVRVTSSHFLRMAVIDGEHLIIGNVVPEGAVDTGWHITDRNIVLWVREVYLMLWGAASNWRTVVAPGEHMVTSERQRRILRELEAGSPQHEISSRTGLKQRTVERELLSLRERLGGWTIYQVMSWWGRSAERDTL